MPDNQNTTQNPTPEENPSPTSPQEPTEQGTENTAHSEPSVALPEAPESSPSDFQAKSTDIAPSDSTLTEPENEPKTQENKAENEPVPEPQPKTDQPPAEIQLPETAPEPETAQIPVNEPLPISTESPSEVKSKQAEIEVPEIKPEPTKEETKLTETKISEPKIITESKPIEKPEPVEIKPVPVPVPVLVSVSKKLLQKDFWKRFLVKVQIGKRKKLEKIMTMFLKKSKITNDEVEKFLHVSDATATRYLSQLEKEGRIKQSGKTGKGVSYSKI